MTEFDFFKFITQTSHIKNTCQGLKTIALRLEKHPRHAHFRSFCDSSNGSSDRKSSSCSCIFPSSHIGCS